MQKVFFENKKYKFTSTRHFVPYLWISTCSRFKSKTFRIKTISTIFFHFLHTEIFLAVSRKIRQYFPTRAVVIRLRKVHRGRIFEAKRRNNFGEEVRMTKV